MKPRGYFWCDTCDDRSSGWRCEHGHEARFVHVAVALTVPKKAAQGSGFRVQGSVDPERARQLFAQIHQQLQ